ncbi:MAG: regulator, partial [Rhodoplanes sp.]|uniref:hypothetical protein n=1 Tax=Rhodoplanes sp. TaxID=1968906 RepID=UPI0017FF586B
GAPPGPAATSAASTAPPAGTAPASGGTLPAVRQPQPERRAAGPSGGNPGTVLAQIARGMLARK